MHDKCPHKYHQRYLSARIRLQFWRVIGLEKRLFARRRVNQLFLRHSDDLHDARHLLHFVLAGKERVACAREGKRGGRERERERDKREYMLNKNQY